MDIAYRKGKLEDLECINEMISQAIGQMERAGIYQWDMLYPTDEDFRADIESGTLYVGYVGKDLVLVYVLNKEFDEEYKIGQWRKNDEAFYVLHRLCVNPLYQNRGIGRAAMDHVEKEAALKGASAIRLDVFSQNPYALNLYTACGYEMVGKVEWRKGTFFLMEKYLT